MRTTFLVGRRTPKSTEMVVVRETGRRPPFPGPWTLKAMVRPHTHEPVEMELSSTIH